MAMEYTEISWNEAGRSHRGYHLIGTPRTPVAANPERLDRPLIMMI